MAQTQSRARKNSAEIILSQLGGRRFMAMTGARYFLTMSAEEAPYGGLQFRIPRNKGVNTVRIKLNALDLYDVEFGYVYRRNGNYGYNMRRTYEGVYADQLRSVFEDATGLYTSLGG